MHKIKSKVIKLEYKWKKSVKLKINAQCAMITTKLEIILSFGIIWPLLYPITIFSIKCNLLFYSFMINKLKWKINFIQSSNDSYILPFYCLWFGILFQQTLLSLFLYICCKNKALSIVFCVSCIVLNLFIFNKIRKQ